MLKVKFIGNKTSVFTGNQWEDMINVTFQEEGRGGANASLAKSSAALDAVLGISSGLETFRTHTQAMKPDAAARLTVGQELPLFINRELHSTPQMKQQEGTVARKIDGKPTYFVTTLEQTAKEDIDKRLDDAFLEHIAPGAFAAATNGNGQVVTMERKAPGAIPFNAGRPAEGEGQQGSVANNSSNAAIAEEEGLETANLQQKTA